MLIGGSEGRIFGIKLEENIMSIFAPNKNVDVWSFFGNNIF